MRKAGFSNKNHNKVGHAAVVLVDGKTGKPIQLPINAQWLAGEGALSWFHIEKFGDLFKVFRYNPEGEIECSGLFYNLDNQTLDLKISYKFTHLNHCDNIRIIQNGKIIPLKKTDPTVNFKKDDAYSNM
jgi:hypothetical protein